MSAHILSLQEQIDSLWNNISQLRTAVGHELPQDFFTLHNDPSRSMAAPQAPMVIDPALSRGKAPAHQQKYQNTSNSSFSYDIARSSLQSMGIDASANSATSRHPSPNQGFTSLHPDTEPLASFTKDEGMRMCGVFDDEIGVFFPFIDMSRVVQYATLVLSLGEAVQKSGQTSKGNSDIPAADEDMDVLKLVLANATLVDSDGQNPFAKRLFDSTYAAKGSGLQGKASLPQIQITLLTVCLSFKHMRFSANIFRQCIIFTRRMSNSLGGWSGWPHGSARSWACTEAQPTRISIRVMRTAQSLPKFFGRSTSLIGGGVQGLECPTLCKNPTSSHMCQEQ